MYLFTHAVARAITCDRCKLRTSNLLKNRRRGKVPFFRFPSDKVFDAILKNHQRLFMECRPDGVAADSSVLGIETDPCNRGVALLPIPSSGPRRGRLVNQPTELLGNSVGVSGYIGGVIGLTESLQRIGVAKVFNPFGSHDYLRHVQDTMRGFWHKYSEEHGEKANGGSVTIYNISKHLLNDANPRSDEDRHALISCLSPGKVRVLLTTMAAVMCNAGGTIFKHPLSHLNVVENLDELTEVGVTMTGVAKGYPGTIFHVDDETAARCNPFDTACSIPVEKVHVQIAISGRYPLIYLNRRNLEKTKDDDLFTQALSPEARPSDNVCVIHPGNAYHGGAAQDEEESIMLSITIANPRMKKLGTATYSEIGDFSCQTLEVIAEDQVDLWRRWQQYSVPGLRCAKCKASGLNFMMSVSRGGGVLCSGCMKATHHLEVRQSLIPGAGKGLFWCGDKPIPQDAQLPGQYHGLFVRKTVDSVGLENVAVDINMDYVMELSLPGLGKGHVDSFRTMGGCVYRYINDGASTGSVNFKVSDGGELFCVNPVPRDGEILISYGASYWEK